MQQPNPIIVAENLGYTYGDGPLARPALRELSLTVAREACVALVGVTGSGKSTLAQLLNGLLRPTGGRLLVAGIDVGAPRADLRALRRAVGMLFQQPESQLFAPTVLADVAFGPIQAGLSREQAVARAVDALELVGLPPREFAQRSPFGLSGGQQRRAALAGVLALEPQLLVLDEPTVGMDARGRAEFYHYIAAARAARGVTVVLITHDMAEAAALADWLVVLSGGALVAQGPPAKLFAQPATLRAWGLAAPPLAELLAALREAGITLS